MLKNNVLWKPLSDLLDSTGTAIEYDWNNNWGNSYSWDYITTSTFLPQDMLNMKCNTNSDGTVTVTLDMPGIKKEDIAIEISGKMINVKGERKTEAIAVSVTKSFSIPEGFSADNAVAELQDGVLSIKFTEKLPSETKNIPII